MRECQCQARTCVQCSTLHSTTLAALCPAFISPALTPSEISGSPSRCQDCPARHCNVRYNTGANYTDRSTTHNRPDDPAVLRAGQRLPADRAGLVVDVPLLDTGLPRVEFTVHYRLQNSSVKYLAVGVSARQDDVWSALETHAALLQRGRAHSLHQGLGQQGGGGEFGQGERVWGATVARAVRPRAVRTALHLEIIVHCTARTNGN